MLVITIIITLILLSVTIAAVKDNADGSAISNFASEITELQDGVKTYYMLNNSMPEKSSIGKLSQEDVLGRVDEKNRVKFSEELKKNNDDIESASSGREFYALDLVKIEASKTNKGLENKGKDDIYIVAYPSFNVYYLKGLKAKGKYFFSASSAVEFTNVGKNEVDNSNITIVSTKELTVTKDNSRWTNKMGIRILSDLKETEKLYINISGVSSQFEFKQNIGKNIAFNSLEELNSSNILVANISPAQISTFNGTNSRYIEVVKKDGVKEIGKAKIELDNYDNFLPSISGLRVASYDNMNIISFLAQDSSGSTRSGIREVRYEYLTKFDDRGNEVPYYDGVTSFDDEYMRTKAKKVSVGKTETVDLKIPKNVKTIVVAAVDNASNINKLNMANTVSDMYINHRIDTPTKDRAFVNLQITSQKGVSVVETAFSADGINYILPKSQNLNTNNQSVTAYFEYDSLPFDISTSRYIKVSVTDNNVDVASRKKDTKVIDLNESGLDVSYAKDGLLLRLDAKSNVKNYGLNSPLWRDLSKNQINGVLTNVNFNDASGWKTNALKFDGENDWVDLGLPAATTFTADSDFTLSIMFDFNKITNVGGAHASEADTGVLIGAANYNGYGISWTTMKSEPDKAYITSFIRTDKSFQRIMPISLSTLDKKVQVTQVYSKSTNSMKMYVNGVFVGATTAISGIFDRGPQMRNIGINQAQIFHSNYRATYADINVYTASIYNRALSDNEVRANYQIDRLQYAD